MPADVVVLQRAWRQHNVLFYSIVCCISSALIFTEAFEKIFSQSATLWSPLVIFGPPVWLPITVDQGYLIALQAMVISAMYCPACYFLFKAQNEGRKWLLAPWMLMHFFIVAYQVGTMLTFRKLFQSKDLALSACTIFLNLLLLWSSYVSMAQVTVNNNRLHLRPVIPCDAGRRNCRRIRLRVI